MKKKIIECLLLLALFIAILLFYPCLAKAETFYCTPLDSHRGYICLPVDFELREFDTGEMSEEKYGNGIMITSTHKFRCYKNGKEWKCLPFDKDAVLLEDKHECNCNSWRDSQYLLTPNENVILNNQIQ